MGSKRFKVIFFFITMAILLYWTSKGTGVEIIGFIKGIPSMKEFLISMFPPNFRILPKIVPRIIETIQMAIISVILATSIALPFSFLAAKNTSPSYFIYRITRFSFNLFRSIPTLLYALIFIAMVGLGPFPGILGLTLHVIGTLGKYFSEAIENINPGIIEAAEATGANKIQIIIFAIIPELQAQFLGYILYYLEYCIRTASMMGVVGAGGIGMTLLMYIRLFRFQETLAILIVIVLMVTSIDAISFLIRKRMIGLRK